MLRLPARDWLLIAAAASLTTLAYPPFALGVPMFVCLVPAALLILGSSTSVTPSRRLLAQGFWYGVVVYGTLLHWMALGLWNIGGARILLFPLVAVAFGAMNAVMFLAVGTSVERAHGRLLLALPAGVVALEWLTAHLGPLGFPWYQLALAATASPVVVQAADVLGAEGLSFALAAINSALALAWWTRRDNNQWLPHLEIAGMLLFAMTLYGLHRLNTLDPQPGASVAVIQPNVGMREKWLPGGRDAIVLRTLALSDRASAEGAPGLVVWPETALPDAIEAHPEWKARLVQAAHVSGSSILTGAVEQSAASGASPRYNATFVFEPNREPSVVHRKRQLVPVIERALPLVAPGGGLTPGDELRVTESRIGRYGVLLCYELTFPGMARELRREGADFLVTLSNDAWFGRSVAPRQHFAHAVLRAVENRVTVVRAANTGISGIVDPMGSIVVQTTPSVDTFTVAPIQHVRSVPLAASLGGLVGPISVLFLFGMLGSRKFTACDLSSRAPASASRRTPFRTRSSLRSWTRPTSGFGRAPASSSGIT